MPICISDVCICVYVIEFVLFVFCLFLICFQLHKHIGFFMPIFVVYLRFYLQSFIDIKLKQNKVLGLKKGFYFMFLLGTWLTERGIKYYTGHSTKSCFIYIVYNFKILI